MLQLSDSAIIALHLMIIIGSQPYKILALPILASNIQKPANSCSKILQRLVKEGFLSSSKGPKGGFSLLKPTSTYTIKDVLEAIDGPLLLRSCLLDREKCILSSCFLHPALEDIQKKIIHIISSASMEEIITQYYQIKQ